MIFSDDKYALCLSLATAKSRSGQVYGAILEKNDRIIGLGRNSLVTKTGPKRVFRQGYANHAEGEAINNALLNLEDISGSILYVAGCFRDGQLLIYDKTPLFTCTKCVRLFEEYDLKSIKVPTISGWAELTIDNVINLAPNFSVREKGGVETKRKKVSLSNYDLSYVKNTFPISFDELSFPYLSTPFLL